MLLLVLTCSCSMAREVAQDALGQPERPRNFIVLFDGAGQDKNITTEGFRDVWPFTSVAEIFWAACGASADERECHQKGPDGREQYVRYWSGPGTEAKTAYREQHEQGKCITEVLEENYWKAMSDKLVKPVAEKLAEYTDTLSFMTGLRVTEHVFQALEYLMKHGMTANDRLYIIGFSRSGVQSRLLQGILATYGLPADGSDMRRLRNEFCLL
ncbi:unnamed protein product [Vitrella brassicaformis CCMP3155]|uniref:T6SS Phospholipase effector Tle1-like catalytic domain-containing protein n=1 Tax=Vitrella brassicaformis (strain CCMP3155) TaxID=1169540 RepID=A0A0G4FHA9_VITBC|nr:unnamed protein product [Vitrella brassicaformis CCMP3155]|eukprot:CEM12894.1 unnamed protein product [Vitrella brassicaformis CCMP3155]